MKKIILLIGLCLCSTTLQAQQKPLDNFFNKYKADTSFTVINISPEMFSLFAQMASDSAGRQTDQVMDIARKLTGLRIITKEDAANSLKLYKEAKSALAGRDYENLMTIRDGADHVKFLVKQGSGGSIHNLIMLIGGSDDFFVMSLTGDISLSEISQLAGSMDIQGFDKLKDLKKLDDGNK